jgi:hypothetical protein
VRGALELGVGLRDAGTDACVVDPAGVVAGADADAELGGGVDEAPWPLDVHPASASITSGTAASRRERTATTLARAVAARSPSRAD